MRKEQDKVSRCCHYRLLSSVLTLDLNLDLDLEILNNQSRDYIFGKCSFETYELLKLLIQKSDKKYFLHLWIHMHVWMHITMYLKRK